MNGRAGGQWSDDALAAEKQRLRGVARERMTYLRAEDIPSMTEAAAANLVSLPELTDARCVLGYAAFGSELDPALALAHLRAMGVRTAYPRVVDAERLALHIVEDHAELTPGTLGIPEPSPEAPTVAPDEIDAAIVPGVAFDAACARIGHGAGYYDRLLPLLRPGVPIIGYGFGVQMVEEPIPLGAHDVPMDVLVTPAVVLRRA